MSYTLTFKHPDFPDDYEFGIAGLGRIKNGGTLEVDEENERRYIAEHGMTLEDAFRNSTGFEITGGSTLERDDLNKLLERYAPPVEVSENEAPAQLDNWVNEGNTVNAGGEQNG